METKYSFSLVHNARGSFIRVQLSSRKPGGQIYVFMVFAPLHHPYIGVEVQGGVGNTLAWLLSLPHSPTHLPLPSLLLPATNSYLLRQTDEFCCRLYHRHDFLQGCHSQGNISAYQWFGGHWHALYRNWFGSAESCLIPQTKVEFMKCIS